MCNHQEEKAAVNRARDIGLVMASEAKSERPAIKKRKHIEIVGTENGFIVQIGWDVQGHIGLLGTVDDRQTFVAKNLEEATEIILAEGRRK